MSLSYSTLVGGILQELSEFLDTLDELHTAGIEFTVRRDNGSMIGLEVFIQILQAEQKQVRSAPQNKKDVKKPKFSQGSGV